MSTFRLVLYESTDFLNRSVESDDSETVISGVEDQILTHDGQTDETKVSTGNCLRSQTSSDAGQARTTLAEDPVNWMCHDGRERKWRIPNACERKQCNACVFRDTTIERAEPKLGSRKHYLHCLRVGHGDEVCLVGFLERCV